MAAAIGDDANFSTTITNSIATKLATSDFNSTFDPRFNTQLGTKDTDDLSEGTTNLYHTDARARSSISVSGDLSYDSSTGVVSFSQGNSDTVAEGTTNLYHTDARAITAVTGSDLDMGSNNITTTGQLLFKNMFATSGDLPSATTYHGMFAHVHATGKAYFAHAGNWIGLLDTTTSTTANLPEGTNLYYTDARVDTHLNTGSASSGQILSWNGSDYAWVADQTGSGGTAITIQEEGSSLSTAATTINFVGSGVTASGTGATKTITVSGGGAAITVQEEGSSLSTAAETLNFVGSGVTASGTGATKTITIANLTNAEVRTAVEAATDSNVFTDADHTKLGTVETNAKDDLTGGEIKALYEAQSNTNAFTDADNVKLGTVETNASADQTDAEIRAAVEAATDSNVFTDADHTKLNAIEASATADQTDAEIRAAVEAGYGFKCIYRRRSHKIRWY